MDYTSSEFSLLAPAPYLLHIAWPSLSKEFWDKDSTRFVRESCFHPLCLIRDKSTQFTNTPRLNSSKIKPRVGCGILACYNYEIIKTSRFLVRNSVSLVTKARQIGNYRQLFIILLPWTTFLTMAFSHPPILISSTILSTVMGTK